MKLTELGELGLVAEILKAIQATTAAGGEQPPQVTIGPGDDCAGLALEGVSQREALVTVDQAVEGVHFDLGLPGMTPRQVGRRTMAASLSDLAAMAGRPRATVVALALPPSWEVEAALELSRGLAEVGLAAGAPVVGGNVARVAEGAASVTVTAIGDVKRGRAVRRAGAKPADELWVTGTLGSARAGLLALRRGLAAEPSAKPLVDHFLEPAARIEEAQWLAEKLGASLHAMIDLSDGLAGDLAHLCGASGVGARLYRERIPVATALRALALRLEGEDPVDIALAGGEDYELLLAAAPGTGAPIRADFEARFPAVRLTRIGDVKRGNALAIQAPGEMEVPLVAKSYRHF